MHVLGFNINVNIASLPCFLIIMVRLFENDSPLLHNSCKDYNPLSRAHSRVNLFIRHAKPCQGCCPRPSVDVNLNKSGVLPWGIPVPLHTPPNNRQKSYSTLLWIPLGMPRGRCSYSLPRLAARRDHSSPPACHRVHNTGGQLEWVIYFDWQ